jgi:hypothetical protein
MFAKLLIIIVAIGAAACALLVVRQQRVELAHDVAMTHNRLLQHESALWDLRTEIAARVRPGDVRLLVDRMGGEWSPIPASPELRHVPTSIEDPLSPGVLVSAPYSVLPYDDDDVSASPR